MSSYFHGPPYATYPQQRTQSPSPPHPQSHPWSYDVPERSRYSPRPSQGPTGGQRTPSAGADSKLPRPLIGEDYYAWRASAPSKYDGRPRAEYVPQPLDPDSEYIVRDASPGIRHHTGTSAGAGFRSSSIRDDYEAGPRRKTTYPATARPKDSYQREYVPQPSEPLYQQDAPYEPPASAPDSDDPAPPPFVPTPPSSPKRTPTSARASQPWSKAKFSKKLQREVPGSLLETLEVGRNDSKTRVVKRFADKTIKSYHPWIELLLKALRLHFVKPTVGQSLLEVNFFTNLENGKLIKAKNTYRIVIQASAARPDPAKAQEKDPLILIRNNSGSRSAKPSLAARRIPGKDCWVIFDVYQKMEGGEMVWEMEKGGLMTPDIAIVFE